MIRNTMLYLVFLTFLTGLCFAIYSNNKHTGSVSRSATNNKSLRVGKIALVVGRKAK